MIIVVVVVVVTVVVIVHCCTLVMALLITNLWNTPFVSYQVRVWDSVDVGVIGKMIRYPSRRLGGISTEWERSARY